MVAQYLSIDRHWGSVVEVSTIDKGVDSNGIPCFTNNKRTRTKTEKVTTEAVFSGPLVHNYAHIIHNKPSIV